MEVNAMAMNCQPAQSGETDGLTGRDWYHLARENGLGQIRSS